MDWSAVTCLYQLLHIITLPFTDGRRSCHLRIFTDENIKSASGAAHSAGVRRKNSGIRRNFLVTTAPPPIHESTNCDNAPDGYGPATSTVIYPASRDKAGASYFRWGPPGLRCPAPERRCATRSPWRGA